ncbi:neuraminidase-like domain-containing protein, partial [Serratia quinivorans]|uniref:neuraminidase-like domain-containing protein n=2 Tax=Serratia quinivorans TaxID=137545 RepID=UPI0034C68AE8
MDQLSRLLNKLNMGRSAGTLTLEDIMPLSRAELHRMAKERLSGEEVVHLHRSAQREQTENKLFAARALTRANPLLAQAIRQASRGVTAYGINDIIDPRTVQFATPGSVASMFSPAAYLTELYREARHLHPQDSVWQLDKRRPDLAKLTLNQQNMDEEISTLALANQLQMSALMTARKQTPPQLMETLATVRNSGVTPYHAPFSSVHHALTQHKVTLSDSPLGQGMTSAAQLALQANIAPELHAILTEKTDWLSEVEIAELVSENFPDVSIERLMTLDGLTAWYALPREQIQQLLEGQQTQMAQTPDLYRNNQLLTHQIEEDGRIVTHVFNKIPGDDSSQANYLDLLPLADNRFAVNFSMANTHSAMSIFSLSTDRLDNNLYSNSSFVPQQGQHYSLPVTFAAELLAQRLKIGIKRASPADGRSHYTSASFTRTPANPGLWLLKLNKTLRLAKASGLAPLEVERALARLRLPDDDSAAQVIHRFYEALHYRQRYAIDLESALMLCNADISQIAYDGQLSQFDRLFNNPPFNDVRYTLGGSAIPMLPDASDPRREVLKRALRVDNIGLWQLFNLTARDNADNKDGNNIENLSDLLLVRLLADTHGLSVAELHTLLTLSPFNNINIYQITERNRRGLIDFLWQTQQWLTAQNGSVNDVWALLTQDYGDKPTADMQPLLEALRSGAVMETELQATMAPIVATVLQLDTPTQGEALLRWLDNHRPATVPTTAEAWALIKQPTPDALAQKKIAHFCQALAQRVLTIRAMALSEAELQTLAQGAAVDTVAGVRAISDFHRVMDRCGDQAGTILDALQAKTLSAKPLAQALNLAPVVLTEALTQAGWKSGSDMTWQQLAALPAWLDLAQRLQITPTGVGTLLALSQAPVATYGEWSTLAALLLAGLTPQQSLQVQQQQNQRLGEALSGDYRATIMAAQLEGRDEIWRRLLVDGQVSAEVTTTRLAEAIASVQLYINRTLAGQEPGADKERLDRQFFKDWARYNKGYSTWAGVSQLAYYPENTIDPTLRIGQSGMMDEMLQQLAQSQLNSDTLEEGFRQYLTAFEQVANLKVASGYHDHPDIHQGNTWFIGYSQSEPRKYYWRSLDHSKGQDGRFAANAWSEWREIACAVTPYQGLIRPVIYRSRLYVLWVEEQQRKTADGKKDELHYALKLSHIHYDGSWASPFSFDITADLKKEKVVTAEALGLYSTANNEDDALTVALYQKRESYNVEGNKLNTPYFGIRILADMTRAASTNIGGVMVAVVSQLDTTKINRVNNALGGSFHTSLTLQSQETNLEFNFALEADGFYVSQKEDRQQLVLNPVVEVTYTKEGGLGSFLTELPDFEKLHFSHPDAGHILIPENCIFTPKNGSKVNDVNLLFLTNENHEAKACGVRLNSRETKLSDFVVLESTSSYKNDFGVGNPIKNGDKFIFSRIYNNDLLMDTKKRESQTYDVRLSYSLLPVGTLEFGKFKNILVGFNTQDIVLELYSGDKLIKSINGSDVGMANPGFHVDTLKFAFGSLSVDVSDVFKDNKLNLTLKVSVKNKEGVAATADYALTLQVPEVSKRNISLHTTDDGAQYMALDCYRTRLNTLFAQQLIARASRGVDAVLSRETQSLMEPKLGKGTYVTLTLAQYDKAIHGSDRRFSLQRGDALVYNDIYAVAGGTLSLDSPMEVRFFIPQLVDQKYNLDRFFLRAHYQSGNSGWIKFIPDGDGWKLDTGYNKGTFSGLVSVGGLSQQDEPMDFSGANALYFWELFYYTPMMVASRLLQEQDFSEANRWLRYVWDPAGGTQRGGVWNTRPLDEDTTWNDDPLDSVDPDAVAQHDPMHYKMSTVMRTLDLLMARGDAAYRLLERDTLNEAKMWYVQALTLLGEKP